MRRVLRALEVADVDRHAERRVVTGGEALAKTPPALEVSDQHPRLGLEAEHHVGALGGGEDLGAAAGEAAPGLLGRERGRAHPGPEADRLRAQGGRQGDRLFQELQPRPSPVRLGAEQGRLVLAAGVEQEARPFSGRDVARVVLEGEVTMLRCPF